MRLNLLSNITIDIWCYRPDAGWFVCTNIPEELLDTPITVQIERPYKKKNNKWIWRNCFLKVNAAFFLDEILAEIVKYVKSINKGAGEYFTDHRCLESLELDTDTMVATTLWGA